MDYEALGRYTEAVDDARRAHSEFEKAAKELDDELKRVVNPLSGWGLHVPAFDSLKIRLLVEEAARHHGRLVERGHEANLFAERCAKPRVTGVFPRMSR